MKHLLSTRLCLFIAIGILALSLNSAHGASELTLLKDIAPGPDSSWPGKIKVINNHMFFWAKGVPAGSSDYQLWVSDGTEAGTSVFLPGIDSEQYTGLAWSNGLYFFGGRNAGGLELWVSDGTLAGARLVKDINPGPAVGFLGSMQAIDGGIIFLATDGVHGLELWRSDGTEAGTLMLKDIQPGAVGSFPVGPFLRLNGQDYFWATTAEYGRELWRTDGTPAGTTLVKDVNPGPAHGSVPSYPPQVAGDYLLFAGQSPADGSPAVVTELWASDGTEAGTFPVRDAAPASADAGIAWRYAVNAGYLSARPAPEGDGYNLWSSATLTTTPTLVRHFAAAPGMMVSNGSLLFFTVMDAEFGMEVWRSDGTAAGTFLLRDSFRGGASADVQKLAVVESQLIFTSNYEIWKSDGTPAGTTQLGTSETSLSDSPATAEFATLGDRLFFSASTADHGREIYSLSLSNSGAKPVVYLPVLLK